MNKFIKHMGESIKLLTVMVIKPIYKLFQKKEIYLIGERKEQCQDNGYHLFKYVREKHKEDRFYYCITKDSNQLDRIKDLDNIVYYKSFKHYLYYVLSRKLVCAHIGSCTPDSAIVWKFEEKNIIKKNRVFIQHGVTKEILPQLMYPKVNLSAFVCGAKPEYEFVKDNFNFPDGVVKYLGLCRFDNLHDIQIKKQILIMPTWRQWFGMNGNNEMSEEEFLKSEYFIKFNELINSKEFDKCLRENSMMAIFYPHNEMQRYLHLFNTESKQVIVANKDNYDVQTLLKESTMLITDYSSVAFDFAYMKKTIVYYQFDKDKYNNNHYKKGYFDYERDGFGVVVSDLDEVIKSINNIDNKFVNRSNKFFKLYDRNNCERNYKEIIK